MYLYKKPGGKCICGQRIAEHCVLENKLNHKSVTVGNICVRHFDPKLHVLTTALFRGVERIEEDPAKAKLSVGAVDLAMSRGILTDDNVRFYKDVYKKRV